MGTAVKTEEVKKELYARGSVATNLNVSGVGENGSAFRSSGHWVWAMPSSCIRATVHRSVQLRCCFARRARACARNLWVHGPRGALQQAGGSLLALVAHFYTT